MSVAQFKAAPEDFLSRNLLLANDVQDADCQISGLGIRVFTFELKAGATVTNIAGGQVFTLRYDSATPLVNPLPADQLAAYWCPYRVNHQFGIMLEAGADVMFTAEMSGCSLGIGSEISGHRRAVFHANKEGGVSDARKKSSIEEHLKDQIKEQKRALKDLLVPKGNIISPKFYAGGIEQFTYAGSDAYRMKYKSTTLGLRTAAGWSFYTLKYRRPSATNYEHGGLAQFVPLS